MDIADVATEEALGTHGEVLDQLAGADDWLHLGGGHTGCCRHVVSSGAASSCPASSQEATNSSSLVVGGKRPTRPAPITRSWQRHAACRPSTPPEHRSG